MNDKNDLITIIIPIYKSEKYLKECVDSILNQTYKNLEIILVDDASPDSSGDICDEYSIKDKRVKVIHNNQNHGVSFSRNSGVEKSNGKYITFIDSDDFVSTKYIETLYKLIIDNDVEISIIGNDEQDNGKVIKVNKSIRKKMDSNEAIRRILEEKYITSVCWGKMYKKTLFRDIKFDENMRIGEDLKFIIPILCGAKAIFVDTNQTLYHYRINIGSVTQQGNQKDSWMKEIELSRQIIKWAEKEKKEILKNARQRYVRVNITFLTKMIKEESQDLYDEIKIVKNNIKGLKLKYLFMNSTEMHYKIKLILIVFCPKILIKLYELKDD